jgi:predicted ribosomally synthesized peptide with SipW-like signal peptide
MTRRRKVLVTILLFGIVGAVAGSATYSAFTSTTTNTGNVFSAGTVSLTDNDGGSSSLLALTNAKPGDADTGCIRVAYDGTLPATVRLYASVSGSLADYLTVTVTRGTDSSPSFDSCANFTADGTNYIGQGNGVIYSGTLSAFPATYAAGLVDPTSGSPESWTNPESHSYRFQISLNDTNAAQDLNGSATFTWEARNQ